jgi:hypothetical protein
LVPIYIASVDGSAPDYEVVGELDLSGQLTDIRVAGGFVYLADGSSSRPALHVVDVSDATTPRLIASSASLIGAAHAVAIRGDRAWIGLEDAIVLMDVSTPASPFVIQRFDLEPEHELEDLIAREGHVYARTEAPDVSQNLLYVFDQTSLLAPARYSFKGGAFQSPGVTVFAGTAYLPIGIEQLEVVDVRNPSLPELLATSWSVPNGLALDAENDILAISSSFGFGLFGLDVPTLPSLQEFITWTTRPLSEHTNTVILDGSCFHAAHYSSGLITGCFSVPPPVASVTVSATTSPTPSATSTLGSTPTATQSATLETPSSPAPTATTTPSPTKLPTATETPNSIDPPTPTPVWTVTSEPSPTTTTGGELASSIFLPIALLEQCPPKDLFTDVVLVIDASTSMRDLTADHRQKIDVAVEAAQVFVNGLRLDSDRDRVAIIVFNEEAATLQRLTDDKMQALSALARIRISEQSRVDLGVERATVELVARGRPGHVHAMIVLSDGKVNQVDNDKPGIAARQARHAGITVFVVGMGPSMDERILRDMASSSDRFYRAPEPRLIRAIYADLTTRVPCPPDAYWGRR